MYGNGGLLPDSVSDVKSHIDCDENEDNTLVVAEAAHKRLPHLPIHVDLEGAYAREGGYEIPYACWQG
jgi:hypothetical protein